MYRTLRNLIKGERPFFFAVPLFVWQFLFFYCPLAIMAVVSIRIYSPELGTYFFSLDRYWQFFSSTYFLIMLKSILLATSTGILCFVVGYPLAYFLAFGAGRFKLFFLFLLILPFWTNFLLHVYAWFFVLDRGGIINLFLQALGLIAEPLHLLNSLVGVMILMVYCYLPFMVLPIYAVLERLDYALFEASNDLGATPFETWYHVILPLSMSGVLSGFFLVFIPSFGEFAIPGLMGGEKFLFVGSIIVQYALGHQTIASAVAFTMMSFFVLLAATVLGCTFKKVLQYIRVHHDT